MKSDHCSGLEHKNILIDHFVCPKLNIFSGSIGKTRKSNIYRTMLLVEPVISRFLLTVPYDDLLGSVVKLQLEPFDSICNLHFFKPDQ